MVSPRCPRLMIHYAHLSSTRWLLILVSLVAVSLASLVGMSALALRKKQLAALLPFLISLAAGALLGAAGAHLLPEAIGELGTDRHLSGLLLAGFVGFFLVEKAMHIVGHRWPAVITAEHHHTDCESHDGLHSSATQSLPFTLLFGGAVHSIVDGAAIAIAYAASPSAGIGTSVAVLLHEVPHHIGDVAVLIYSGVTARRAVLLKFIATSASLLGALIVFVPGPEGRSIAAHLLPVTAASFIYIALANLMPELHKERSVGKSLGQVVAFVGGILLLYALNLLSE